MATSSLYGIGESIATTSFGILENVGRSTFEILTVKEEVDISDTTTQKKSVRRRPIFLDNQTKPFIARQEDQKEFQDVTNVNYYEKENGIIHQQVSQKKSFKMISHFVTADLFLFFFCIK